MEMNLHWIRENNFNNLLIKYDDMINVVLRCNSRCLQTYYHYFISFTNAYFTFGNADEYIMKIDGNTIPLAIILKYVMS